MLFRRDYDLLLTEIGQINQDLHLHVLPDQMLKAVRRLVGCDHASYNELNPEQHRAVTLLDEADAYTEFARVAKLFPSLMHQNPLTRHFQVEANRHCGARKITDLVSRREYQHTELYQQVYRFLDTEFQLVVPIPAAHATIGIALNRKLRDFSERDRTMLNLFAPHLAMAYQRALSRWRLRLLLSGQCDAEGTDAVRQAYPALTTREAQVLYWVVQGKTNPQIGTILGASPRTISKHLERTFQKLGVESRTAAITQLIERL